MVGRASAASGRAGSPRPLVVSAHAFHLGEERPLARGPARTLDPETLLIADATGPLAIAGVATLLLVWRRSYAMARWPAVVAVASVVSGWGVAQYPWLLVDEVTVSDAAGATATLQGLLVAVGLAVILVLPPLIYLLRLTQSEEWTTN